ncbi:Nucleolar protein 12 [Stygiomarasmius scandens]|uniref:Nucleolar protein 12 n=1 Tax=Marasmiellus scandens TaxID=2682957 RepID=A0ABR1JS03_9AGAR
MSLSSVLLSNSKKKSKNIDSELDALFKSSAKLPATKPKHITEERPASETSPKSLKRKHDVVQPDSSTATVKRAKATAKAEKPKKADSPAKLKNKPKEKKRKAKKQVEEDEDEDVQEEEEEEEDNSDLENAYLRSRTKSIKSAGEDEEEEDNDKMQVDEVEGSEEDDADALPPQHESLSSKKGKGKDKSKPKRKEKYIPDGETPVQRDARTIFIGNLSLEVAQKKSHLKALQRHILSLIPSPPNSSAKPKIESTRFRSVPFSVPTSRLPDSDEDDDSGGKKAKNSRQHEIDRSSSWKKSKSQSKDAEESSKEEKKFLTPAQKKKIAFINQDFHSSADACHAYIVFAHPHPHPHPHPTNPNIPLPPPVMDPYTAAKLAKEACDGSMFMERAIRVDIVAKSTLPSTATGDGGGLGLKALKETEQIIKNDVDPKRCVFVGNLDFESREEDLRVFFEGVISGILGPRVGDGEDGMKTNEKKGEEKEEEEEEGQSEEDEGESDEDEEEDESGTDADDESEESDADSQKKAKVKSAKQARAVESKQGRWVTRVRIIRDKDTQLGKGFAYVQFATRECVDEVLTLEPTQLKFAKRKLRVERCKTLPGGRSRVKVSSSTGKDKDKGQSAGKGRGKGNEKSKAKGPSTSRPGPVSVPKGDPSLGQKLAHLSKEERKAAKAADADRMARRLAKKKARMAMATGASGKGDAVKVHGKERSRERKTRSSVGVKGKGVKGHGAGSAAKNKSKKKSERSLEKRNVKK